MKKALEMLNEINEAWEAGDFEAIADLADFRDPATENLVKEARAAVELINLARTPLAPYSPSTIGNQPNKVVSILHTSLPEFPGGYSSRAHGLLKGLQKNKVVVAPYTRPGYFQETIDSSFIEKRSIHYDGIRYAHLPPTDYKRRDGEYQYMFSTISAYREVFRSEMPNVVHLRSTYLIALPALIAAHQLGIPTIYEVSGLWELVHQGRNLSGLANRITRLEDETVKSAVKVVTMNNSMAELLKKRNVENDISIDLLPNAVSLDNFTEIPNLSDTDTLKFELGYVGSLLDYEGLETLIYAVKELKQRNINCTTKIVGGGPHLPILKEIVVNNNLEEEITFSGPVNPEDAIEHLSSIKIIVLPRLSTPATECVTPLKPFEAMAAGRPLVVSSVHALREVAESTRAALVFEQGNSSDLADKLEELLESTTLQTQLSEAGRNAVRETYNWEKVADSMCSQINKIARKNTYFKSPKNFKSQFSLDYFI